MPGGKRGSGYGPTSDLSSVYISPLGRRTPRGRAGGRIRRASAYFRSGAPVLGPWGGEAVSRGAHGLTAAAQEIALGRVVRALDGGVVRRSGRAVPAQAAQ